MGLYFTSLLIAAILGLILYSRILFYLKIKHEKTWKLLYSPTLFGTNSMQSSIAMLSFIFGRQYLKLRDRKLNWLCGIWFAYGILYLGYFVFVVVISTCK